MIETRIAQLPRASLGHFPTPLESAPRLAASIGLRELYFKRDDQSGLAFGGSKVRQLEFLVGKAVAEHAQVVVAYCSSSSNFARLTAAACARVGLVAELLVSGMNGESATANVRTARLCGAQIRPCDDLDANGYIRAALSIQREKAKVGARTFVMPFGGASAIGIVGYLEAFTECMRQLNGRGAQPDFIVLPVGSGGTLAGLCLGQKQCNSSIKLIGISVGPSVDELTEKCTALYNGAKRILGLSIPDCFDAQIEDSWVGGGYGVASNSSQEASKIAARSAGIVLDPYYTGKAMAALISKVCNGVIDGNSSVLFWHTGGSISSLDELLG
jgi:1-aminocyclopropane-1-carboxylate deaminase/D-cysteine desulfhydrase-like pyridoxal-dependent ACC family enzyme